MECWRSVFPGGGSNWPLLIICCTLGRALTELWLGAGSSAGGSLGGNRGWPVVAADSLSDLNEMATAIPKAIAITPSKSHLYPALIVTFKSRTCA